MKDDTIKMTFRAKKEIYLRVHAHSEERMCSHNRIIERAVEEWLEREEKKKSAQTG